MKELAKQYDPSQVEDRIYQFWLDGGYFHTKADPDKPFAFWPYSDLRIKSM